MAQETIDPIPPRQRVKGPAVGLLATGLLNCTLIALPLLAQVFKSVGTAGYRGMSGQEVLVFFAGAVQGPPFILGGLCLFGLRSYGLALAASILALLPLSPCCALGLPVGLWALNTLLDPEVKAAFGRTVPAPRPALDLGPIEARVALPALALTAAGVANCATLAVVYLILASAGRVEELIGVLAGALVVTLLGPLLLIGAVHLRRLESYRWAVAGSVLAMLSPSVCCFFGLPVGVWVFRVLRDPEVKAAFRD
jgi:hypothetical protein